MENQSIFQEKEDKPNEQKLKDTLGSTFQVWNEIHKITLSKYPKGIGEWFYSGKKYGWNYRIKDKRRALIYFQPVEGYFKVSFVFGDKALKDIYESDITSFVKDELKQAPKYGEGTAIQISIENDTFIEDIDKLISFKLKY